MMPEHTLTKDTGAGMARTQEGLHIWLHGEGETRVWAGAMKEGIGRRRADHLMLIGCDPLFVVLIICKKQKLNRSSKASKRDETGHFLIWKH